MTADCLQNYATRLGNAAWCRHWLHWNYPAQEPWLMAISCMDSNGESTRNDLERHGFTPVDHEGILVYTIPRTDETGQPYRSRLL